MSKNKRRSRKTRRRSVLVLKGAGGYREHKRKTGRTGKVFSKLLQSRRGAA